MEILVSKVTDLDLTRSVYILTGVAGSVATVLHDAVMNPAEGKKNISKKVAHCPLKDKVNTLMVNFFMSTNAMKRSKPAMN